MNTSELLFTLNFDFVLQLLSLTLDGMTGASQDRMRADYQTHAHHMMLAVNKWSIIILGVGEYIFLSKQFLGKTKCI